MKVIMITTEEKGFRKLDKRASMFGTYRHLRQRIVAINGRE